MTEQMPPNDDLTLLCLDLEAGSAALAGYAAAMAQRCNQRLQVLHVAPADSPAEELSQRRIRLDSVMASHSYSKDTQPPPCEVASGIPDTIIPERARTLGAARIVIGRRRRSEVERIYVGSTTSAVISEAPCAVLVVPLVKNNP